MASTPIITFKAGRCDFSGRKVTPLPTPGYIYLYSEDDMYHFCWRPRSALATEPDIDLLMIPGDGAFEPVVKDRDTDDLHSPTTGRIFVLKFNSSSQKHFFWMQSKTQDKAGDLSYVGGRDRRLGEVVDQLLQGEDPDVELAIHEIQRSLRRDGRGGDGPGRDGDGDAMEVDQQEHGLSRQETGGAGADATGGDPRDEGEANREGGADGGRAADSAQDTNAIVQNFLKSLGGGNSSSAPPIEKPYTTLPDLLTTSTTIPYISTATPSQIDTLCSYLPPEIFLLAQESSNDPSSSDPNPSPAAGQAAIEALSTDQKKEILNRVLRSPQLQQSLGSLTVALRDGGLPMIGEALGLKVQNGGVVKGGSVPLGGGEAVEGFVEGVKRTVDQEGKGTGEGTEGGS